jgi:hypothetical protein
MKSLKIKEHNGYRAIFVDEELFDWEMDAKSLEDAKKFHSNNPSLKKSVEGDIQSHFLESFSEFIGKPITLNELVESIRSQSIEG